MMVRIITVTDVSPELVPVSIIGKKRTPTPELVAVVKEQLDQDRRMREAEAKFTKAMMEMRR